MVVCELCRLIGLPHVKYKLASEFDGQRYIRPGVVCENMSPSPAELVLGNELLLAIDPQYPVQQRLVTVRATEARASSVNGYKKISQ